MNRVGLNYIEWPPGHGQLSTIVVTILFEIATASSNQFYLALIFLCLFHGEPWLTWSYEFKFIVTWESIWSCVRKKYGVVMRELQTDMKIANSMKIANPYENCKHPCRKYTKKWYLKTDVKIANWYENCKLIWKLQTDMKIGNWYENCKLIWTLQSNSHVLVSGS